MKFNLKIKHKKIRKKRKGEGKKLKNEKQKNNVAKNEVSSSFLHGCDLIFRHLLLDGCNDDRKQP